jgi:hypothetical protein
VLFSSNFFDLGAIFLELGLFLFSKKGFFIHRNFPPENLDFLPFGKKASCSWGWRSATCTSFYKKMLITATTSVTLPVFAVSIAISSDLMLLRGAVSTTLIGQASVDK